MQHLIVVRPFGSWRMGDVVTRCDGVEKILASEHADHVVRITPPEGNLTMPIVQSGSLNTTALVVPDLYVQVVPPQNLVLNGVPTNIVGVVGTASWGPVNQPVIVATMADYARSFGPIQSRKYDMGTQVATAVQQGAQNVPVRPGDGRDGHRGELRRVLCGGRISGAADGSIQRQPGQPDRGADPCRGVRRERGG